MKTQELLFPLLCIVVCAKPSFVIEIAKHGDRYPETRVGWQSGDFPSNELSEIGMKEQALLGAEIRSRYSDLLDEDFSQDVGRVLVRTTNENATIASAVCQLRGLYQKVETYDIGQGHSFRIGDLPYTPPVHTESLTQDTLLSVHGICPTLQADFEDYFKREAKTIPRELLETIRQEEQTEVPEAMILPVYRNLQSSVSHHSPAPESYTDEFRQQLEAAVNSAYSYFYGSKKKAEVIATPLLSHISGSIQAGSPATRKLQLFVAGDEVMIALMTVFGMYTGEVPLNSSNLIIEVRHSEVTIAFNDIPMPDCNPCTKDYLLSLLESNIVTNFDEACYDSIDNAETTSDYKRLLSAIAIIVSAVVILCGVVGCVCMVCRRKDKPNVQYTTFAEEENDQELELELEED